MESWHKLMEEQVEAGLEAGTSESGVTGESMAGAGIETFAARYPFTLDAFQVDAMRQLDAGQSVLVAAPTGTGKTIVAEYAIWRAQQRGQRVIYTTPLKALSNQKYRDMRALYGPDAVGLVTGDIVEHSNASIVIMTTEVYRNMLLEEGADRFLDGAGEPGRPPGSPLPYTDDAGSFLVYGRGDPGGRPGNVAFPPANSALADVGFIVFDELHYLSDIERGPVWEEAIICSPPHIQLVGLSATVSNASDLADWISRVHRPISLVVHEERAVPLEHFYFLDNRLHLVMDAEGRRVERFPNVGGEARLARMRGQNRVYTFGDDDESAEIEVETERAGTSRAGDKRNNKAPTGQPREANRAVEHSTPEPGEILTALREADLLPCLYFLPGRRAVEDAAIGAALHRFTTPQEEALIREEIRVWLEHLPKEDRNLRQVYDLASLLPRGLAYHHAGLLPGLKVLVETLFQRGHLRAVFATDTLALGINMPARAVVVGSLSKFDGQEMRLLTPNEYRQLTGRAGRRGMDRRGAAVIPYSPWEPFEESFQRITAELLPVTSSFIIRYNTVLNLWRPGDIAHLRRISASSLREYQRYLLWERREMARLEQQERRAQKGKKGGKKKGAPSAAAIEALEKRRKRIGAHPLSRAGAAELDGTIFALRALGYIDEQEQLTLKGRLLRSIFHPAGIFLVELITRGSLDELTPAELAEVCSWFVFDQERRLYNRDTLNSSLLQVRREFWRVSQHVHGIEEQAGITASPGIVSDFHGVALAWSRGMTLSGLLRRIELAEGDLLMLLNQTIDLLQQVQAAVGQLADARDFWPDSDDETTMRPKYAKRRANYLQLQRARLDRLRPLQAQAVSSLLRGIILQSRSVPSMSVQIGSEEVPLDAEEDADPRDVTEDV